MKERILKTLKAYLLINKEVLSQEEIKDIEEQIKVVERYKFGFRGLFGKKKKEDNRKININVIREKELINNQGKKFYIAEVKPEIIFISDENNNFITLYCGDINEDNLELINRY